MEAPASHCYVTSAGSSRSRAASGSLGLLSAHLPALQNFNHTSSHLQSSRKTAAPDEDECTIMTLPSCCYSSKTAGLAGQDGAGAHLLTSVSSAFETHFVALVTTLLIISYFFLFLSLCVLRVKLSAFGNEVGYNLFPIIG